jgi:hypothetical protein
VIGYLLMDQKEVPFVIEELTLMEGTNVSNIVKK